MASSSGRVTGRVWTDAEYGTFLDIWMTQEIQSKLDGTVRNNAVFNLISESMAKEGYDRTSKEIKNKMKNVKRIYKKVSDHNKRSGVQRKELQFQDKLDIILGDRPSSAPVATFVSMPEAEDGDEDDEDMLEVDVEELGECFMA